jgi:methylaspartate ammonia-lyase
MKLGFAFLLIALVAIFSGMANAQRGCTTRELSVYEGGSFKKIDVTKNDCAQVACKNFCR